MHAGAWSCAQKVGKVSAVPVVPELPDDEPELLELLAMLPDPLDDDELELELLLPDDDDDDELLDAELELVVLVAPEPLLGVVPPPSLPLPPWEQPATKRLTRQPAINERQRIEAPEVEVFAF